MPAFLMRSLLICVTATLLLLAGIAFIAALDLTNHAHEKGAVIRSIVALVMD